MNVPGATAGLPVTPTGSDTLAVVLRRGAVERGEALWVVFEADGGGRERVSYGQMWERACRMAGVLGELGVGPGDRVHIHLPNCVEFFDVWFGASVLGAVVVPTNPLATADDLAYVLSHGGCRVSVTQPALLGAVQKAQSMSPDVSVVVARTGSAHAGAVTLAEVWDEAASVSEPAAVGPLDPAAILYTSGTTGWPKGVVVTHANYLFVGEAVAQWLRVRPDDRWLVVLPLFHGNAMYYTTMSALVSGASVALMERFSASGWARHAARHEATLASLFAAPMRMILAQPPSDTDGRNRLRATMFAQNVTAEQLEEFERRFRCPLVQLYGMTETVAPPVVNPLYGQQRNLSIGRPALWAKARVVDDDGRDVPVGEVGQLLVGGEPGTTLMAGYHDNPTATTETLRDGWLHTGDNVRADPDGYLHFVDRSKDMVKRAGENVASAEVERVVHDHPAVYECAAVGVPDPIRDEAIKVFVVRHPGENLTEEQLIDWCSHRLAPFKIPSFVEFVADLPRTSVGKIQKHLLRDQGGLRLSR